MGFFPSCFPDLLRRNRHFSGCIAAVLLMMSVSASYAAIPDNAATFLTTHQQADGSWSSTTVRQSQATVEALRALQGVTTSASARAAAVSYLEAVSIEDTDDRARRIKVLASEGRTVTSLVTQLLADKELQGGWGLTPEFLADPLDTALALAALASQPGLSDDVLRSIIAALVAMQNADGGWPCTQAGDDHSHIFCTSEALLALAIYRNDYFLTPQVTAAVNFLRSQWNPDGSVGPADPDQIIHTALASLALGSVSAFDNEPAGVISFLSARQQSDGSWDADPYTMALALRAFSAITAGPYCGDGLVNRAAETCDGGVPTGLTCAEVGKGTGTLACTSQCTLNTSGCSIPPTCGDNLRNQSFEVCDGTDLAGRTCQSLGFATGNLACASDCQSFNTSVCNAAPTCGDGVVNQPGESCDLSDLNGTTCESLGLGDGLLSCTSDCNVNTGQCAAASSEIDNKGREFVFGFLNNNNSGSAVTIQLHLISEVATSVTVQYPVNTPTFLQTVAVTPGQVTVVNLPPTTHSGWTAGRVLNNAVRVSGPDEFVAYLVNRITNSSDAAMGLPIDALGTSYLVTTFRGSALVSTDRSEFLVVAPFDDTTVTITPTATLRIPSPGPNVAPGVPYHITLPRGQGFRGEAVFAGADFTGTEITANRPVAVLNGNLCTNVPTTTRFCDHIFEMAPPLRSWGTSALVSNLPNRPGGSMYRIVASEDGTQVTRDGVLQTTLNRGQFLQVGPLAGSHVFAANHPIFVAQFMTGDQSPGAIDGDPSMVNMIPPDQYLKSYTFATVGGAQFRSHFLTVIAPNTAVGSVSLDGAPIAPNLFSPISGTSFSSTVLPLAEGSHTTSSPQPHGITVEGLDTDDSYIYPGGARVEFINQFCGDGSANRQPEECDGPDFRGATCSSLGFASGFLQCTGTCMINASQCAGFTTEDKDADGSPVTEDCNDLDPQINPAMPEFAGNGLDDDCNPATPDVIPPGVVSCGLVADRLSYTVTDLVKLEATVNNVHQSFSLTGLTVSLTVHNGGAAIFEETRDLAPLPPGARAQQNFVFAPPSTAIGNYQVNFTVATADVLEAQCTTSVAVESSTATGAGLVGTLVLNPALVTVGTPSDATYTLGNQGNATLSNLQVRLLLLDPDTGAIMKELSNSTTLNPGANFGATQRFSTTGLAINKNYLAVLLAKPNGTETELTLASAVLAVFNAAPICTNAFADAVALWPPDHRLVPVTIGGVTDPDGDPITIKVNGVLQDEETNAHGSGDTCPDATGIGTSQASIRAERSGRHDGRVYHVSFVAEDGQGGRCEGNVTVCVRHDDRPGATCIDQGPLFDATQCQE